MPSRSPTAHFLGIELATDQLRAAVVDEQLDLVGVEVVDFDSELTDFQLRFLSLLSPLSPLLLARLAPAYPVVRFTYYLLIY